MPQRSAADSLDGLRLNFALQAGILRLLSRQEHLNKINVFPVPDGDTGTNLALTVNAVLGSLRKWPDRHAGKTLTRVADAALDGARGNSGAILAQFFLGLCDRVGHLNQIDPADFAAGVDGGAEYARESLSEPREGTILTVLTAFAHAVQLARKDGMRDFRSILRQGVAASQAALAQTTFQLEALRKANVVDAGAQGFVELIEGVTDYLESGSDAEPAGSASPLVASASEELTAGSGEDELAYRYCTECVVTGERIDRRHLREQLSAIGGSLVVAGLHSKIRVHIHANDPSEVFRVAARFGDRRGREGRRHAAAAALGALDRSSRRDRHRQRGGHSRSRARPARHPHDPGPRALRCPQLPRQGGHHAPTSSMPKSSAAPNRRRRRSRRRAISAGSSSSSARTTAR